MREWMHIFTFSGAVRRQQARSLYIDTLIFLLSIITMASAGGTHLVVLANWEAEIERMEVRDQHRQIVYEDLSPK
jgi:hypothetical protein